MIIMFETEKMFHQFAFVTTKNLVLESNAPCYTKHRIASLESKNCRS